ncbi:4-hydroxythreonine-4-phosphate dehydrogenase PdxA [Bacteriovoracaceae bacterium]|nr:4-hydroxythreonine-4-phosphate dehydrogenase PdxA [Bacteriovoracaceae bacterium]
MIYITQGSDKSIGIEILLRSLITFPQNKINKLCLIINKECLKINLTNLNLNYDLNKNELKIYNRKLKLILFDKPKDQSNALHALLISFNHLKKTDTLITQPASKNDFKYKNKNFLGHTEFFRYWFKTDVAMLFTSDRVNLLLLTDHIPLKQVHKNLDPRMIKRKISLSKNFLQAKNNLRKIYFLGVNPHAGEAGLLGKEELKLKKFFKNYPIIPGDSVAIQKLNEKDLIVSPFHDQGLTYFKTINDLYGINISLGLPFLRVSVDHGTAPTLFGKNSADISSMIYLLNTVL